MLDAQITAAILGVGLAGAILYLVRRDHLHGPFAAWWLMVAAATLILGMFPSLVVWLGKLTSMVLLRLLKLDIDRSRQERRMRRLTQKLAILEQEIEQLRRDRVAPDASPDPRIKPN